jgi:hypothetical protein
MTPAFSRANFRDTSKQISRTGTMSFNKRLAEFVALRSGSKQKKWLAL